MSKNNPAASAAMQLGGIFTALVGSMPLETLIPTRSAVSYSAADVNALVGEANKRIRSLNNRVRQLKDDGGKAVQALTEENYNLAEYVIELETRERLLRERIMELEASNGNRTQGRGETVTYPNGLPYKG